MLISRPELTEWIRQRVDERAPTAVVRFGDGEAQLLTADPADAGSMQLALDKLRKETGLPFSPEAALEIKALVALAFEQADVLGIRFYDGFSEESKRWLGKLAALHSEQLAAGRPAAVLAHCLVDWDPLPELLAGRRVSVISCRDVKPALEAKWGLRDVAVYQVPSQHMVRDVDGAYESAMHEVPIWPDAHARIRSELTIRERGEVFLVGAGLFGKDLCIRVREHGGIALDVGSTLDQIAGKITRGPKRRVLDLHEGGMSVADIAADFHRTYGVRVDPERISAIVDEVTSSR